VIVMGCLLVVLASGFPGYSGSTSGVLWSTSEVFVEFRTGKDAKRTERAGKTGTTRNSY